jgi:hypothetical protein
MRLNEYLIESELNEILDQMLEDIKISPAVQNKTMFRLRSFMDKTKGDWDKFTRMVNLRTRKMNKVDKLIAWFRALEDENFHQEAKVAYDRIRELGYEGAI